MSKTGALTNTRYTAIDRDGRSTSIVLQNLISESGEGVIYWTDKIDLVAKLYHKDKRTTARVEKLHLMLRQPPIDPAAPNRSIIWPMATLHDSGGSVVGFTMPGVKHGLIPRSLYVPLERKKEAPSLDWYHLLQAALNVAKAFQSIHDMGYVIGDVKSDNLLVTPSLRVCLVDTDSFQVVDKATGKIHPCPVASAEFAPPEMQGANKALLATKEHDNFGLAIIIYSFLFTRHPYSGGILPAQHEGIQTEERIARGLWQWNKRVPLPPHKGSIPLEIVHPRLLNLFRRCFDDGHSNPSVRPHAGEWAKALQEAITSVTWCAKEPLHVYSKTYGRCPWCEQKSGGLDIFKGGTEAKSRSLTLLLDEFDVFIKRGDLPAALELIDHHNVLKTDERTARGREIIGRNAATIREFRQFCTEIKQSADEVKLIKDLKKKPALRAMAQANNDTRPYLNKLLKLSGILDQLDAAIEKAEGFRARKSIVCEEAIVKIVRDNIDVLSAHKGIQSFYGERLVAANRKVVLVRSVLKAIAANDVFAIVQTVQGHWQNLKDLIELRSYVDYISELIKAEAVAQSFVQSFNSGDAETAARTWERTPGLGSSPFADMPRPDLGGRTIKVVYKCIREPSTVDASDITSMLANAVATELATNTTHTPPRPSQAPVSKK
ncbi:Protein kinase domain-containing protein [Rhizobium sp. RU35A]|uniref:protein kinase domain-containing protein n=1 Tax=Rhizobium sp. RU35A TaxID=1907414 RepID=UPI000953C6B3|nr:hypothetical protein [Rhizobium sp. RU35A]SIR41806.1 Protein kinase domain-containing protein [Rhizobium sp. RU35A]